MGDGGGSGNFRNADEKFLAVGAHGARADFDVTAWSGSSTTSADRPIKR